MPRVEVVGISQEAAEVAVPRPSEVGEMEGRRVEAITVAEAVRRRWWG